MQKIYLIIGLFLISSCYALEVLNQEQYIKEAQSQITEESLKIQEKQDARLPVSSKATVGKVATRKIRFIRFNYAIFIIGDDSISRQWLIENKQKLEANHALGFIANIKDSEDLQALQKLTKAPLLPANVDDFMVLLKEQHYPLALINGELWQ